MPRSTFPIPHLPFLLSTVSVVRRVLTDQQEAAKTELKGLEETVVSRRSLGCVWPQDCY